MSKIKVGIIGGTGLENADLLKNATKIPITTCFGEPSDGVAHQGDIENVPCVILSRHGKDHDLPPSKVNFRANIWALKELACTHIIATSAMGSLKEEVRPGDLVILSDFIDRTYQRRQSFYDGGSGSLKGLFHLPMHPPFSEPLRKVIYETAKKMGLNCHASGTVVTIEGPRFSSRAESKMFQMLDCDTINMTTVPEVMLAKEAGLLYAVIGVVTDYDCWKDDHESVSHEFVMETFKKNSENVRNLIVSSIKELSEMNWDKDVNDLKMLVEKSFMSNPK